MEKLLQGIPDDYEPVSRRFSVNYVAHRPAYMNGDGDPVESGSVKSLDELLDLPFIKRWRTPLLKSFVKWDSRIGFIYLLALLVDDSYWVLARLSGLDVAEILAPLEDIRTLPQWNKQVGK